MKREGGFTLVEVGLALAVSSALIIVTFGMWGMSSRQRMQDAMTILHTNIQSQYEEVHSSINPRFDGTHASICANDGSAGSVEIAGNSQCFFIGRLVKLSADKMTSYYIVAKKAANWPDSSKSDVENLQSADLYVITSGLGNANDYGTQPQETTLQNGNTFFRGWAWNRNGGSSGSISNVDSLVILHSPTSSSAFTYTGKSSSLMRTSGSYTKLNLSAASRTNSMLLAIKSGGSGYAGGGICIDGNSTESSAAKMILPATGIDFNIDNPDRITLSATALNDICGYN